MIQKKIFEAILPLCLLLTIPLVSILYPMLNHPDKDMNNLVTVLDRSIPVIKWFILPYFSWYVFVVLVLVYVCFKDRILYYRTLLAYNIGLLACFTVYFFYQTTVPRPDITGSDYFSQSIINLYQSDQPFNCFPSIHVLTTYMVMRAIESSSFKTLWNRIWIQGYGTIIIMSTLFVKQHVILDAVGAIFLVEIIFRLVSYYQGERVFLWKNSPFVVPAMKEKSNVKSRSI